MKDIYRKINLALENSGYSRLQSNTDFRLLGEGAWHEAYLVKLKGNHWLVIRFPKKQAYGKSVSFNWQEMFSEYSGNGLYYQQANAVMPGICPEEYEFYVDPELTYTIESYMGKPIDLSATDTSVGRDYGVQLGDFFRKMDDVKPNLTGFGHLIWEDGKLKGEYNVERQKFMADEKDEFLLEWAQLRDTNLSFDRLAIQEKLLQCLENRSFSFVSLTNQDTSPENLIIHNGRVHIIDPLPVLYSGFVFAGNHVNNYQTLFLTYYKSPRYVKHQFHKHKEVLHALAAGFEEGYTERLVERKRALKIEQFLQLFSLCHTNYRVLQKEINKETYMRMGDKQAIESRLPIYLEELEAFELENL
ncbi:hypothetical protein D5F11_009885 [Siminovitchia terrae]|uniref:Aminoglycoside phosphotransferase domain-containing protein n=1 Tax=Siminovitchia terrae TaxID=1914933 RepID=A0A429X965_SIMTE|nr:hypothetical protein [Siminovitchia terrae]RST59995.1 hypothetical protein D5F11_009885 [Siminovitchia terrae]